nr:MAG TPA: hypothetical protein [Caudoviricetes sp.]
MARAPCGAGRCRKHPPPDLQAPPTRGFSLPSVRRITHPCVYIFLYLFSYMAYLAAK